MTKSNNWAIYSIYLSHIYRVFFTVGNYIFKVKFHPDECKVVAIKHILSPLVMLPFVAYLYDLPDN